MLKKFLYALITFAHGVSMCSDFEPNLDRAISIKSNKYFNDLTPDQYEIYRPQINSKYEGFTPIERAVWIGKGELADWLLLNGADVNKTSKNVLSLLFKSHSYFMQFRAKTVALLLERGVDTNFLIGDQTPLDLTRKKLADLKATRDYTLELSTIERADWQIFTSHFQEMENIVAMLKEHDCAKERWSPARRAWGSAVWRGGEAREILLAARKKT